MDKIISLIERLERVKLARDMEPDPDGLSLSLWAMGAELALWRGRTALIWIWKH